MNESDMDQPRMPWWRRDELRLAAELQRELDEGAAQHQIELEQQQQQENQ